MSLAEIENTTEIALRPPEHVMRLRRLGSMHLSRLSFTRNLIRTARRERWNVRRHLFDLDENGFGRAVYTVSIRGRDYSLVAFSQYLAPEDRIDRVIAVAWDTCYVLYDGIPDQAELDRLAAAVPYQEARRYSERELVLARANKSERLFDLVKSALAAGQQPEESAIQEIGYLLRTSAVYGNGKFGIADYSVLAQRPEFSGSFVAEMLTVWLIRNFTVDLVEHCAKMAAPDTAVRLDPHLRRQVGVGNSTGLGMAPFLVRHPALIHRWIHAREVALARVRAVQSLDPAVQRVIVDLLDGAQDKLRQWVTVDFLQGERIETLKGDLVQVREWAADLTAQVFQPWDLLYRRAEATLSLEAQEYLVSILLEPHGALVDELCSAMAVPGEEMQRLVGSMSCGKLMGHIKAHYEWALALDFTDSDAMARFWYTSQEKLEPRLGWRGDDEGDALELPLGFARDVSRLAAILRDWPEDAPVSRVAIAHPELRHAIRRVQVVADHPYGEIHDNLLGSTMRPIDLMRCKLAFFGAEAFDPRSDLSLRIRLFQGAPFADELQEEGDDGIGW
ncbi:hypothetical protein FHS85_004069 [Rhodoligotrophos appendicifer]|uniref:hypothetical protein n=1 Tax=Rhodoligotrophos appendicifer TaxID=987056 RepID=UPI001185C6BB|nr:hypothetical protein [Rhodoligotrophos appendicifer]